MRLRVTPLWPGVKSRKRGRSEAGAEGEGEAGDEGHRDHLRRKRKRKGLRGDAHGGEAKGEGEGEEGGVEWVLLVRDSHRRMYRIMKRKGARRWMRMVARRVWIR